MPVEVVIVPGLGGSGPLHWQTLWQERHGYRRAEQADWEHPDRDVWLRALTSAIEEANAPVVLVAHSAGCALVAHVPSTNVASRVAGALLVAPADVDLEMHTPDVARCFSPLPLAPLPFPSIVVASRTDPYVRFARAEEMARAWHARFVDAGRSGHINVDSGHGQWEEGHRLLEELLSAAERA